MGKRLEQTFFFFEQTLLKAQHIMAKEHTGKYST